MAGRRTNLALLGLLALAFASGLVAYAIGAGWVRWMVVAHAVTGLAILTLAPWKSVIVRRGVRRWRPGSWASIVLSILAVLTIGFGVLHSTGTVDSVLGVSPMQIHVGAAVGTLLFGVGHVVVRPVRPRRTDLSRRNVLRAGAVLGGTGLFLVTFERVMGLASIPGADRRFTGSHERGTGDLERMPVTQWFNDSVPDVDPRTWRLAVRAGEEVREWTHEELLVFDDRTRAIIDCTGGWFAAQDWSGVRLSRLLPPNAEGRGIEVRSVTGYGRRFPLRDLENLWVATRVGGRFLDAGHGFPARIVAPGRRGFWWVKWIRSIEVTDTPWWWQSPFPLS